ncbi:hypothetical protein [Natrinema sp. 1APR25-10V2]|uniref:hypothetical protein n=1 Tax=Natrinema sp. 1APR25-10V2 TaxID=2951081 RepID=UPI00287BC82E|nr:hypothetical protein [Natrinema sp. 1APR25-10V2]
MVETIHRGPLSWLTYLNWDGQFYKINEEVVDEGRVSGPEYVLSRDSETENLSPDDSLSFANLPRHDQWRVSEAADFNIEHLGGMRFSIPFIAGYLDATDQDESVLAAGVDEPVIEANGSIAELKRTGKGDDTAQRFRYTAGPVFEDVSSFSEYVLDRRGSTSFDPSDEVRILLDEVKENDGHLTICDQDTSEDKEAAKRRRNAASDLKTMFTSLKEASDREKDSDSEPLEYVRYEGDWHYIDVSRSHGV